jgi:hypothetical protein
MLLYKLKRYINYYANLNAFKTYLYRFSKNKEDALTIIITSSGRKEYLKRTLSSLRTNLDYEGQIYWHIIDDDPSSLDTRDFIMNQYWDKIILNSKNRGLGYSLNRIYRTVKTKYVFHCEDDWEFLEKIYINPIIKSLNNNEQLIFNRKTPYKYKPILENGGAFIERYYSFNPHLVMWKCIIPMLPFSNRNTERTFSDLARKKGIKSKIYGFGEKSYVEHLGVVKRVRKY